MQNPTSADFKVASCQATIFTPDLNFSLAQVMKAFYPAVGFLDAEPVVMSAPPEIPGEIPRVILATKTGEWRCEVASARLNFFLVLVDEGKKFSWEDFLTRTLSVLDCYDDAVKTRVARLASVLTRYVQHASAGRLLVDRFCRAEFVEGAFKDVGDFELHAHRRSLLGEKFRVNSWIRNKVGTMTSPNRTDPILLIEQDINTLPEDLGTASFKREEWSSFFRAAEKQFDETLDSLYPRGMARSTHDSPAK